MSKAKKSVYLVARFIFTGPCFGVERKTTEGSGAYLFEINDVCLEGGAVRFLGIEAMAGYAARCLSCQGIPHCLTETGAIVYDRGVFCRGGLC